MIRRNCLPYIIKRLILETNDKGTINTGYVLFEMYKI